MFEIYGVERWGIFSYSGAAKYSRWCISSSLNTIWAETPSGLVSMLLFYNQRNWFLVTWWISKYPLQHWHKRIVTSRSRCDQIKIERSSSETTIKFTLHIIEPKLCIEYIWNIMVIILHHYYFPKINQLLKSGSSSYLCVKINPVFEWLTISALKIGLNFTLHLHNKEIWNLNWQFFKKFFEFLFAWPRLLSVLISRALVWLSYKIWCHRKLCNLHKTYPMDKSWMDQDRKSWPEDIQVKTTK